MAECAETPRHSKRLEKEVRTPSMIVIKSTTKKKTGSNRAAAAATRKGDVTETPRRSLRKKDNTEKKLTAPDTTKSGTAQSKKDAKTKRTSIMKETSPVPSSPPKENELPAKSRLSRLPVSRRRSSVCGPAMTLEDFANSIPSDLSHEEQMERVIMLGMQYALQHGSNDESTTWKSYCRKALNNEDILISDLKKKESFRKFCDEHRDTSMMTAKDEALEYLENNEAEKERWRSLLSNARECTVAAKDRFLAEDARQLEHKRTQGYESLRAEVAKEMEEERKATIKLQHDLEDNVAKWNDIFDALERKVRNLDAQCDDADAKFEEFFAMNGVAYDSGPEDTPRTAISKTKKQND